MLFRKNVGQKERIARLIGGGLMIVCGLLGLQASPLGWAVAAVGAVSMLTGVTRFCPACALGGRKPNESC